MEQYPCQCLPNSSTRRDGGPAAVSDHPYEPTVLSNLFCLFAV